MTINRIWTSPVDGGTLDLNNGQVLTEGVWDRILSNLNHKGGALGTYAARVYKSADQTLTTATTTAITWDSESFDTAAQHAPGANTRLTVTLAGVYVCVAVIAFAGNATGSRHVFLNLDAANLEWMGTLPGAAISGIAVGAIASLSANDFFEVTAFQNSGGNLNVDRLYSHFSMARIGGT